MQHRLAQRITWGALVLCSVVIGSLWPFASAGAAPIGLVTIVEGEAATLLRDTGRYAADEGLALRAEDILRTGNATRLVRIEFDDGRLLDLGPDTEVLLQPRGAERSASAYLARGWAKFAAAPKGAAPTLASPRLDALRVAGTVVLRADADGDWLFVESGAADAQQRHEGRTVTGAALKEGDSFTSHGAEMAAVSRHLPPELVAKLPRMFADPLPRRAARFSNAPVEATGGSEVSYADMAPWLHAEGAVRAAFVPRLTPLALRDARFRSALLADLPRHPEWQRVLAPPPEKPRPKPATAVAVVRSPAPATAPRRIPDGAWTERREPLEQALPAPAERVSVTPVVVPAAASTEGASADDHPASAASAATADANPNPDPTAPAAAH